MKFIGNLVLANQALLLNTDDPIKATAALISFVSLWETFPDIIESYMEKTRNEGLSPKGTVF